MPEEIMQEPIWVKRTWMSLLSSRSCNMKIKTHNVASKLKLPLLQYTKDRQRFLLNDNEVPVRCSFVPLLHCQLNAPVAALIDAGEGWCYPQR